MLTALVSLVLALAAVGPQQKKAAAERPRLVVIVAVDQLIPEQLRRLDARFTGGFRRILDEGAVATYQHAPDNIASARVADAAGFPDRGWRSAGMP